MAEHQIVGERSQSSALRFIILLGLVSLFGDVVYEGARSVTGPYLGSLGASAATVGFIAGFGELLGYGLRLFSGRLATTTKKYWPIIMTGYCVNLLSVPALALTSNWISAAACVFSERIGKSIRTPARDVVLADAATDVGQGTGFALHQTLDSIGAVVGPLFVASLMFSFHQYHIAFSALLLPALASLGLLWYAWKRANIANPAHGITSKLAKAEETNVTNTSFSREFWIYTVAMSLVAAGFVDYPLIGFHLYKHLHLSAASIPLIYTVAMAVEMLVALPLGNLFDRHGLAVVVAATVLGTIAVPLAFSSNVVAAVAGIALWGIGIAAQNSIVKATIVDLCDIKQRANAYGLFGTIYGIGWFAGSTAIGFLYDVQPLYAIVFSVGLQLLAVPMLMSLARERA